MVFARVSSASIQVEVWRTWQVRISLLSTATEDTMKQLAGDAGTVSGMSETNSV